MGVLLVTGFAGVDIETAGPGVRGTKLPIGVSCILNGDVGGGNKGDGTPPQRHGVPTAPLFFGPAPPQREVAVESLAEAQAPPA